MPTESITKEYVINDDDILDTLLRVIEEHKSRRRKTVSGKYEEGEKLLRDHSLSEPQDSKDLCPFNRLTESAEEADPAESAEVLNAIGKLETDDLAITSVEQICLKKRPAGEALKYKGYSGTVEYDAEDDLLVGRIIGINDSICYHGTSIEEIRSSFIDAVENYLSVCEELGKAPDTHI